MEYEARALAPDQVLILRLEASDEADARRQVAARSLKALSITPVGASPLSVRRRRTRFSLMHFSQELLVLLEAGLTVVESVEALAEKEQHADTGRVLGRLLEGMRQGKGFGGALEEMPDEFPRLYVSIVRAAERTSNLAEALGRYVEHESRLVELRSKIVRASIYPLILLTVGSLVALFLLGYVVPRFASVYQETGRSLPKLSMLLLQWGGLVDRYPLAVAGSVLALLGAGAIALKKMAAHGGITRQIQRIPFLARHVLSFQLARMYLTLGMLLDGGLPISQGLGLVADLGTPELCEATQRATEALRQGQSISQALADNGLTTPVALRMLRVGEQSGQMGTMMSRIAKSYDLEVSRAVDWFSRVFEPLLMTFIGVIIGAVVILLYMPIFDLAGSLK